MSSNSVAEQPQRLIERLQHRSVSTLEARRHLDVLHPAARVQELRERGLNIVTHWSKEPSDCGELHRVARYVLLSSPE